MTLPREYFEAMTEKEKYAAFTRAQRARWHMVGIRAFRTAHDGIHPQDCIRVLRSRYLRAAVWEGWFPDHASLRWARYYRTVRLNAAELAHNRNRLSGLCLEAIRANYAGMYTPIRRNR